MRQELSSEAEDPEQKSDDDFGKDALAFGAGLLDESAAKTRNDTVCPFCGEPDCHPLQKNETTVTTKAMVGEAVAAVCSCLGRLDCCAACAAKALKWNQKVNCGGYAKNAEKLILPLPMR